MDLKVKLGDLFVELILVLIRLQISPLYDLVNFQGEVIQLRIELGKSNMAIVD